jgi:hypothetical protein
MQTVIATRIESTLERVDRTGWDEGPWSSEPDRIEWRYGGFPCLIVRNGIGALCGYVGVPLGSKLGNGSYDDVDVQVHGGLTFGGACRPGSPICHTPQPGESEVYWYGFDCCHAYDYSPSNSKYVRGRSDGLFAQGDDVYRDVAFVTEEVQRLADQLGAILGQEKDPRP